MKYILILLLFLSLSITVLQTAAPAAEPEIEPQKIEGKYAGHLEVFIPRPSQIKTYDYEVNIFKVLPDKKEVSLKTHCETCDKRESTLSGCKITAVAPDLLFGCKGDTWHVDYQLSGDLLTGTGITAKGIPFSVKVKKVQETEK